MFKRCTTRRGVDFRPKPGSVAIDRGVILPNITDGFAGSAPDLGALEFGQPRRTMVPDRSRSEGRGDYALDN